MAVIGAGPAGCAAAVQCRRLGLDVILVDSVGKAGGLINEARLIENYPGLENSITGPEFSRRLVSIVSENDLEVKCFRADSILINDDIFEVSGSNELIKSRSVVVAVGTVPKEFSIRISETATILRSILDLKHNPRDDTVIIGGGEAALDYALNLSDSGSSVSVLVRSSRLSAAGKLIDEIEKRSAVQILYNTVPVSASRSDGLIHLEVESSGRKKVLKTDAVLAAVGREPRLPQIMNDFIHERGNIRTSIPGLYIAGDASLGSCGQAAIASGQGIQAVVYACEFLKTGSKIK